MDVRVGLWRNLSAEIDAFELWCWRRLLRVPWTARRSNQSILKEISPGCLLEGLMLKRKLQYFGHLMWRVDSLEKNPDAGRVWGQEEKGTTEGEMVGWHLWLDGHGFEQTPGVGDRQGGLECCDSWGHKESDTTERLNWTELNGTDSYYYKHLTEKHSADCIGYNSKLSNQLFSFPEIAVSQVLSFFESILLMWAPLILTFELFHC